MKKLSFAVAAVVAMGMAGSASAQDGTINFTGKVADETCAVDIGGGGSTVSIPLPVITPAALKSDATAGSRRFTVSLSEGPSSSPKCDKLQAWLTVESGVLTAKGNLKNATIGGSNVVVAIHRETTPGSGYTRVDLQTDPLLVSRTDASKGFEDYKFEARYLVEDGTNATAGDYTGQMIFTVANH